MPATQISFSAFAASLLASVQSEAVDCTPSASPALDLKLVGGLVAHPAASGGECITPCADWDEFDRLTALADETFQVPYKGWSSGGCVLAALANCLAPRFEGDSSPADLFSNLRYHAAHCIGAGC